MRIELTIKTDYLPNWKVWHGLRELIQNGRDAEFEFNAPLKVGWSKEMLFIENDGCVLPHEALLLGHTTKGSRGDLIGKFGEGLKLGILALVREGFPVKIRSGSEVWTPTIERSDKFNADVLVFNIKDGNKHANRVRIEIGGIEQDVWEGAKWKFRFIAKGNPEDEIETSTGTLLKHETMKGHTFVKGIYVSTDTKLQFGYDLKAAELDRDRKMVDTWDFRIRVRDILTEAAMKEPVGMIPAAFKILEQQTPEAGGFDGVYAPYVKEELASAMATHFSAKFGTDAVPVRTMAESKDLDHYGKKGIVVSASMADVLALKLPTVASVKDSLKDEVMELFGWHDLTAEEKDSLSEALQLINEAGVTLALDSVSVVLFRSPDLCGLYKDGAVKLARKRLLPMKTCLLTLVHEVSHRAGSDGAYNHIDAVEQLWSDIVENLMLSRDAALEKKS